MQNKHKYDHANTCTRMLSYLQEHDCGHAERINMVMPTLYTDVELFAET